MFSCSRKWILQSDQDSSVVGSCCNTMYTEFVQSVFFVTIYWIQIHLILSSLHMWLTLLLLHCTHTTLCIFARSHGSWIVSGYFFQPLFNSIIKSIYSFNHFGTLCFNRFNFTVAKKPQTDDRFKRQEKNMLHVAHFFPPHWFPL